MPVAFSLLTKAAMGPARADWKALAVGKFAELVLPATITFPLESTAMLFAESKSLPPRYVAKSKVDPVASSLAIKASPLPPGAD